jgi:hypothetical protein
VDAWVAEVARVHVASAGHGDERRGIVHGDMRRVRLSSWLRGHYSVAVGQLARGRGADETREKKAHRTVATRPSSLPRLARLASCISGRMRAATGDRLATKGCNVRRVWVIPRGRGAG